MRRLIFLPLLISSIPLSALASSSPPRWPASARSAGGRLEISWDRAPEGAREWEAFLSLDGGASFPIRVTPHLSTAVRSFSWPLPMLLSPSARLRVRFGDGRAEREYDVAGEFALRPAPGAPLLSPGRRDIGRLPATGEEQTAAWVEGGVDSSRIVSPIVPPGADPAPEWDAASLHETILQERKAARVPSPAASSVCSPTFEEATVPAVRPDAPSLSRLSRLNL